MARIRIPLTLIFTLAVMLAPPALVSDTPEMTPEQQAEFEAYMNAGTPGAPHRMLASTAGTYDLVIKSWHDPDGPATEERGTSTRKMTLDGRVLVEELESQMMDRPYVGRGMTGFDNVTGKFWSIWTDSLSTGVMVSEGTCDDSHTCTYTGSWNDPIKKAPVQARMITRRGGPKTEVFEMYGPGGDGKEIKMMEITYTRR